MPGEIILITGGAGMSKAARSRPRGVRSVTTGPRRGSRRWTST